MSSSGFVPGPSSKRDLNEYLPSKAPLPSLRVPAPSFRSPRHSASEIRLAIFHSFENENGVRSVCYVCSARDCMTLDGARQDAPSTCVAKIECRFQGQADDPATSSRIFPPRCACATASLMEERG